MRTLINFISPLFLLLSLMSCKDQPRTFSSEIIYAGTFSERGSKGLYVLEFDRANESLNIIQEVDKVVSPSFLTIHPTKKYLYTVNRGGQMPAKKHWGSVSSFSIADDGKLALKNQQSSYGKDPCHISLSKDGSLAFVSNYSEGNVAVLPVNEDGTLAVGSDSAKHEGSSVNEARQKAPHTHSATVSPDGKYLYAADLGIDKVMTYLINTDQKSIEPAEPAFTWAEPGSGPRHFTFHPNGKFAYLAEELTSTVSAYSWNATNGRLNTLQRLTTLPNNYVGKNSVADLHIHPSGNYLYVSNRGHQSIAAFSIDEAGKLTSIGQTSTEGEWPRNFMIDPKGEYMFVANRHTDNITIFKIDQASGELTFTGNELKVPAVVCLKFL